GVSREQRVGFFRSGHIPGLPPLVWLDHLERSPIVILSARVTDVPESTVEPQIVEKAPILEPDGAVLRTFRLVTQRSRCRTPMVSEAEVSGFLVTQQTVPYCELTDTAELADHGTVRVDHASREVPSTVQERRN